MSEHGQTPFFMVRAYDARTPNFEQRFNEDVRGFLQNGEWSPYNVLWSPDSSFCTVFFSRIVNVGQLAASMAAINPGALS